MPRRGAGKATTTVGVLQWGRRRPNYGRTSWHSGRNHWGARGPLGRLHICPPWAWPRSHLSSHCSLYPLRAINLNLYLYLKYSVFRVCLSLLPSFEQIPVSTFCWIYPLPSPLLYELLCWKYGSFCLKFGFSCSARLYVCVRVIRLRTFIGEKKSVFLSPPVHEIYSLFYEVKRRDCFPLHHSRLTLGSVLPPAVISYHVVTTEWIVVAKRWNAKQLLESFHSYEFPVSVFTLLTVTHRVAKQIRLRFC